MSSAPQDLRPSSQPGGPHRMWPETPPAEKGAEKAPNPGALGQPAEKSRPATPPVVAPDDAALDCLPAAEGPATSPVTASGRSAAVPAENARRPAASETRPAAANEAAAKAASASAAPLPIPPPPPGLPPQGAPTPPPPPPPTAAKARPQAATMPNQPQSAAAKAYSEAVGRREAAGRASSLASTSTTCPSQRKDGEEREEASDSGPGPACASFATHLHLIMRICISHCNAYHCNTFASHISHLLYNSFTAQLIYTTSSESFTVHFNTEHNRANLQFT